MVEIVFVCCFCDWMDKAYAVWIGGDVVLIIDVEIWINIDNFIGSIVKRCIGWVDVNVWCMIVVLVRFMEEVIFYIRKFVLWFVMNNCQV